MKSQLKISGSHAGRLNPTNLSFAANKSFKRVRICLRCQANLRSRHRCTACGLKFHDGPVLSWLKKLWGIPPRESVILFVSISLHHNE